jgi:hypothetical protein
LKEQNKKNAVLNDELDHFQMCIRKNSVDSEGVIYDRDQQYDSATNVESNHLIPSIEPSQIEHENKSCNDIRETQVSNDELFNFADVEGEHNREEEDPLFSKSKSPYLNNLADESRSS